MSPATFYLPALLLTAALLGGCAPATKLSGTVTLDQQPLSDGSISFEPVDGVGPSCGGVIKDGRFEIGNQAPITPGQKKVRIRGSMKTGKQIEAGPPHPPGAKVDEVRYFPSGSQDEEVQTVEIVAGKENALKFDLASGSE